MRRVWKYEIPVDGLEHTRVLPAESRIVHVDCQAPNIVTFWAVHIATTNNDSHARSFYVTGTGFDVPVEFEHVGTTKDRSFVWHLFERSWAAS